MNASKPAVSAPRTGAAKPVAKPDAADFFRVTFDQAAVGLAHVGQDGRFLRVNSRWCEITGYSAAEQAAILFPDFVVAGEPELDSAVVHDLLTGQWDCCGLERCVQRKDGSSIWLSLTAARAPAGPGLARTWIVTLQEITRQREAELALAELLATLSLRVAERTADVERSRDSLRQTNALLAQAVRQKDEFLANVSHELRTPLTSILGLAEVLQTGIYGALSEKQVRAVVTIAESGQHLLNLINDILDLSKFEAGKMELKPAAVAAEEICAASLRMVRELAQAKRQHVHYHLQPPDLALEADPRRLKQILVNLLTNAVKFTPVGGSIGLDVNSFAEQNVVNFVVWDHGIGIGSDQLRRLFQPFVQADDHVVREQNGTGLGLALVHRLVTLHGGSVQLESTPGQGSRFTVALPLNLTMTSAVNPQETTDAAVGAGRSAPSGVRILLVDDNLITCRPIADYLGAKGYQVVTVNSGSQALAQLAAEPPQVVVTDVQMPGMDGLELIQRIRRLTPHVLALTPIIAYTALSLPGDRERCLAAGADDYLVKPIRLELLHQTIEAQLRAHQSAHSR